MCPNRVDDAGSLSIETRWLSLRRCRPAPPTGCPSTRPVDARWSFAHTGAYQPRVTELELTPALTMFAMFASQIARLSTPGSARAFPAGPPATEPTLTGSHFSRALPTGDAGSISIEASKLLAARGGVGFTSPSMRAWLGPATAVKGSVGLGGGNSHPRPRRQTRRGDRAAASVIWLTQ